MTLLDQAIGLFAEHRLSELGQEPTHCSCGMMYEPGDRLLLRHDWHLFNVFLEAGLLA